MHGKVVDWEARRGRGAEAGVFGGVGGGEGRASLSYSYSVGW